jgi:hypothetical protein
MSPYQQIGPGSDRLAQHTHELLGSIQRLERELASVKDAVRTDRIELQRGKTLPQVIVRALGRQRRVVIDLAALIRARVDVGIGAQLLVYLSAEQFVDRLAGRLADDVPAGHLERAEHAHHGQIRMLSEAAAIHAPRQRLDVVGFVALQVAAKHVFKQFGHEIGMKRHAIGFPDPEYIVVGRQFDEHEPPAAEMRRRIADHKSPDVLQPHASLRLIRRRLFDAKHRRKRGPLTANRHAEKGHGSANKGIPQAGRPSPPAAKPIGACGSGAKSSNMFWAQVPRSPAGERSDQQP